MGALGKKREVDFGDLRVKMRRAGPCWLAARLHNPGRQAAEAMLLSMSKAEIKRGMGSNLTMPR